MDLASYLASLPRPKLDALYESPWTCRAVLRSLPPLAKQYVLRMLLLEGGLPQSVIEQWHTPEGTAKHNAALARLLQLRVLEAAPIPHSTDLGYALHQTLARHLRIAVYGGDGAKGEPVPDAVVARAPSRVQLDEHAQKQWEGLLLYVVGGSKSAPGPHPLLPGVPLDVDRLLEGAGLFDGQGRGVAARGYKFLLLDAYSQLWILLREYIADADRRSGELAGAMSYLLELSALEAGRPCPASRLPPAERAIAGHLVQLGLLRPFRAEGEVWLSPTRLALALAGSGAEPDAHEGCVIVETNYRVYAYAASALQIAILRLFVRCECLLPNLFVGTISRESVLAALKCGLAAEDIVGYLRTHAHPQVAARVPVVPEVVSDQIRLWQADTLRVRATKAVLYADFASEEMFRAASAFSQLHGWRLWEEPSTWRLASHADGHDEMRTYIRSIK